MPEDLQAIVQKMMDAGESEENIAKVIQHLNPPKQKADTYKGATDFWGGVKESLSSGEAANAGMKGGLGYLKGAILDIPSSIGSGLSSLGNLISDPQGTIRSIPQGLSNAWESMKNTTSQAGSNPEAFGEMMGQVTGQPLVTAGALKAAPIGLPLAGRGLEAVGNGLNDYRPLSRFTPNFVGRPGWSMLEGATGRGAAAIGRQLQRARNIPEISGEVMPEPTPPFTEGEAINPQGRFPPMPPGANGPIYSPDSFTSPEPPSNVGDFGPLQPQPPLQLQAPTSIQLPGNTTTFEPQSPIIGNQPSMPQAPDLGQQMMFDQSMQRALPPSNTFANLPASSLDTSTFEPQSPIVGNQNSPVMPHGIPPEPQLATVPANRLNPAQYPQLLKYAKGKGFEFAGLDSNGNLTFRKTTP